MLETLDGGPLFIVAEGTEGSDTFNGGSGADTYTAKGGNDVVRGGGGNDLLDGGVGNDNLDGQGGDDTLRGQTGNDFLTGGDGNDLIDGGEGDFDSAGYNGASSAVTVDLRTNGPQAPGGGVGIDTLVNVEGLSGSAFNDTLIGNDGRNTLAGNSGDDLLDGLGGTDGAEYGGATSGVTVNLNLATPQNVGGGQGVDTLRNIENVGASFFADTLIGTEGDNYFTGRGGGDRITGNGGRDVVDYRDLPGGVIVNLALGGGNAITPTGTDTLSGIENLTGSGFGDTLSGNAENNNLAGRGGDDRLDGGAGSGDSADYFEATGGVTVDLAVAGPQNVGADQGIDTLINIENVNGTFFADTLSGTAADNGFTLRGGGDRVDGRGGLDRIDYYDLGAGVNVDLVAGTGFTATGADTLTSIERVTGTRFNDTITGSDANDGIGGREGDDVLDGGGGSDHLEYFSATSGVTVDLNVTTPQNLGATEGTDTVRNFENVGATFFADTLRGTAGDNYFTTRGGGDFIDGRGGSDTVDYTGLSAGVIANLATGSAITITGNDTLVGIERLAGTDFADTLTGDANNNSFTPRAGDDRIDGGGGTDSLDFFSSPVGARVDLSFAGPQDFANGLGTKTILNIEQVFGSFFADTMTGTAGANHFSTRGGGDRIDGGAGFDSVDFFDVNGGVTASLVTGLAITPTGNDTLIAIEQLSGTLFADTLTGDANNNNFTGRLGDDVIDGGGGFDAVDLAEGATAGVAVDLNLTTGQDLGALGVDTLLNIENIGATRFADTLTGTAANNSFTTRGGGDRVDGGAGFDTVDFRGLAGGVNANLGLAGPNAASVNGTDTLLNIEQLLGTQFNDTLVGDANANTLMGRQGDDLLDGAGGVDGATYGEATGGVTVDLSVAGPQAIGADQGSDTLLNIENVTGGAFNDTLTGDGAANFLNGVGGDDSLSGLGGNDNLVGGAGDDVADGGEGGDVLQGQAGADTLLGQAGNDQILGGANDDLIDGGDGFDLAVYSIATGGVTVSLAETGFQAVGADQGADRLVNIEQLFGSNFNDTLGGDAGNNFLGGSVGDDSLSGAGGQDFLRGGAGADTLDGGESAAVLGVRNTVGGDYGYFDDATGGVTVDLSIAGPQAVGGGLGSDVLIGIENLLGGAFGDVLMGDGGANYINAAAGNDTVLGQGGDDVLEAGAGDDLLDAGEGVLDIVSFSTGSTGVTADLSITGAQALGAGLGSDTLLNFESMFGSAFNDTLVGDANGNLIDGWTGDDSLAGGDGADTVQSQAGSDTLSGDGGDDLVLGEAGDDSLSGGSGVDTAGYSGARGDYAITRLAGGDVTVVDLRDGSPEGADTLSGFEVLRFSDGDAPLGPSVLTLTGDPAGQAEGNAGTTTFTFTVTRTAGLVGPTSVAWTVSGDGANPATAADFAGGVFPGGVVSFASFETSKTITVNVAGDTLVEPSEGFKVTLSDPTDGASVAVGVATSVIVNDDSNTPVVANPDSASVNEDATVVIDVVANDTDPDAGDTKTVVAVSTTAKGASVSIVDNKIVYVADADSFDLLKTGNSVVDTLSYTVRDANGALSATTVQVTVNGVADGTPVTGGGGADSFGGTGSDERIDGGAGNDSLGGGEGADVLIGGLGNDSMDGGTGIDSLSAGDGTDTLNGGAGDDVLAGGRGADQFSFAGAFGHDTVIDFRPGEDDVRFVGTGLSSFTDVIGHASQVGAHVLIALESGDTLQLNNVSLGSLSAGDFLFA